MGWLLDQVRRLTALTDPWLRARRRTLISYYFESKCKAHYYRPQPREYRLRLRVRCVRQATPNQVGSWCRVSDTIKIALSTSSNRPVGEEVWPVEYCFTRSQWSGVSFENATMTPSHGSGHTMEMRMPLNAATLEAIGRGSGKSMVRKPAPCRGYGSPHRE